MATYWFVQCYVLTSQLTRCRRWLKQNPQRVNERIKKIKWKFESRVFCNYYFKNLFIWRNMCIGFGFGFGLTGGLSTAPCVLYSWNCEYAATCCLFVAKQRHCGYPITILWNICWYKMIWFLVLLAVFVLSRRFSDSFIFRQQLRSFS